MKYSHLEFKFHSHVFTYNVASTCELGSLLGGGEMEKSDPVSSCRNLSSF